MPRPARLPSVLAALALALAGLACGPSYLVVHDSGRPSALAGVDAIAVQFDYGHVRIGEAGLDEREWLATRAHSEQRQTWLEAKDSADAGFLELFTEQLPGVEVSRDRAPPGGLQVTVTYIEWDQGMYAEQVAWPSRLTTRVIFARDGTTLDEIEIRTAARADAGASSPQQRLHACGERVGEYAARYVREAAGD